MSWSELLVGMDIVDVRHVRGSLDRFGARYLCRVYTPDEIAYATATPTETARRLAARFAAKEATIKALRAGEEGVDPRSIHVGRASDGACEIALTGSALRAARRLGVFSVSASISHEGDIAAAVVVAQRARASTRILWRKPPRAGGRR